ncbi:unnamed protein product [Hermetia illucens]|uniref:Uncharacterized protein n=1 Tax=Hermetia illucens TaxID=343691 RepID=A0A7R8UCD7_HERIL|nr:unnamed protein product [Hermetia illucens]
MKFDSLEAPDECVTGIKQYLSCLDSRAWSMDPIQRNLYLKDQIGCGPSLGDKKKHGEKGSAEPALQPAEKDKLTTQEKTKDRPQEIDKPKNNDTEQLEQREKTEAIDATQERSKGGSGSGQWERRESDSVHSEGERKITNKENSGRVEELQNKSVDITKSDDEQKEGDWTKTHQDRKHSLSVSSQSTLTPALVKPVAIMDHLGHECGNRRKYIRQMIKIKGKETLAEMKKLLKQYEGRLDLYIRACKDHIARRKNEQFRHYEETPKEIYISNKERSFIPKPPKQAMIQRENPEVQLSFVSGNGEPFQQSNEQGMPSKFFHMVPLVPALMTVSNIIAPESRELFGESEQSLTARDRKHKHGELFFHEPKSALSAQTAKKVIDSVSRQTEAFQSLDVYAQELNGAIQNLTKVLTEFADLRNFIGNLLKVDGPTSDHNPPAYAERLPSPNPGPSYRTAGHSRQALRPTNQTSNRVPGRFLYDKGQNGSSNSPQSKETIGKRNSAGEDLWNTKCDRLISEMNEARLIDICRKAYLDIHNQLVNGMNSMGSEHNCVDPLTEVVNKHRESLRKLRQYNRTILETSNQIRSRLWRIEALVGDSCVTGFTKYNSNITSPATTSDSVTSLSGSNLNQPFPSFPSESFEAIGNDLIKAIEDRIADIKTEIDIISEQIQYKRMVLNSQFEPINATLQKRRMKERKVLKQCRKIRALELKMLKIKSAFYDSQRLPCSSSEQFCAKQSLKRVRSLQNKLLTTVAKSIHKEHVLQAATSARERARKNNELLRRYVNKARIIAIQIENYIDDMKRAITSKTSSINEYPSNSQVISKVLRKYATRLPALVTKPLPPNACNPIKMIRANSDTKFFDQTKNVTDDSISIYYTSSAPLITDSQCAQSSEPNPPETSEIESEISPTVFYPATDDPSLIVIKSPAYGMFSSESSSVNAKTNQKLAVPNEFLSKSIPSIHFSWGLEFDGEKAPPMLRSTSSTSIPSFWSKSRNLDKEFPTPNSAFFKFDGKISKTPQITWKILAEQQTKLVLTRNISVTTQCEEKNRKMGERIRPKYSFLGRNYRKQQNLLEYISKLTNLRPVGRSSSMADKHANRGCAFDISKQSNGPGVESFSIVDKTSSDKHNPATKTSQLGDGKLRQYENPNGGITSPSAVQLLKRKSKKETNAFCGQIGESCLGNKLAHVEPGRKGSSEAMRGNNILISRKAALATSKRDFESGDEKTFRTKTKKKRSEVHNLEKIWVRYPPGSLDFSKKPFVIPRKIDSSRESVKLNNNKKDQTKVIEVSDREVKEESTSRPEHADIPTLDIPENGELFKQNVKVVTDGKDRNIFNTTCNGAENSQKRKSKLSSVIAQYRIDTGGELLNTPFFDTEVHQTGGEQQRRRKGVLRSSKQSQSAPNIFCVPELMPCRMEEIIHQFREVLPIVRHVDNNSEDLNMGFYEKNAILETSKLYYGEEHSSNKLSSFKTLHVGHVGPPFVKSDMLETPELEQASLDTSLEVRHSGIRVPPNDTKNQLSLDWIDRITEMKSELITVKGQSEILRTREENHLNQMNMLQSKLASTLQTVQCLQKEIECIPIMKDYAKQREQAVESNSKNRRLQELLALRIETLESEWRTNLEHRRNLKVMQDDLGKCPEDPNISLGIQPKCPETPTKGDWNDWLQQIKDLHNETKQIGQMLDSKSDQLKDWHLGVEASDELNGNQFEFYKPAKSTAVEMPDEKISDYKNANSIQSIKKNDHGYTTRIQHITETIDHLKEQKQTSRQLRCGTEVHQKTITDGEMSDPSNRLGTLTECPVQNVDLHEIFMKQNAAISHLTEFRSSIEHLMQTLETSINTKCSVCDKNAKCCCKSDEVLKYIRKIFKCLKSSKENTRVHTCECATKSRVEKVCAKILQKGIHNLKWRDLEYLQTVTRRIQSRLRDPSTHHKGTRCKCAGGSPPKLGYGHDKRKQLGKIKQLEAEITETRDLIKKLREEYSPPLS